MARILSVTWDGGGNVPPMLGVSAELRDRGHDVHVLGHPRQRADVDRAGLGFHPYVHALRWSPTDVRSGVRFFRAYMRLFTDPRPGKDVEAVLRSWPADLLLVDCMSLGALRAALRSGRPTVVLVHVFHHYLASSWAKGPIGAIASVRGMRPSRLFAGADRVLVASDRELDPAGSEPLPGNVHHSGVVQARPDGPATPTEPAVLVSLSTIDYPGQTATLQAIVEALATLPVRVVATVGGAVDPAALDVPATVELHRHVPHDDVMPAMSLVVGHGGHATTMRALAHGLPLVMLPLFGKGDQPMVSAAVVAAGAGIDLPRTASPERIRDAVRTLLADGPHRAAAGAIGARLRAQDGARTAADEIEAVLAERADATRRR